MTYHVDIQHACSEKVQIADETLNEWVRIVLAEHQDSAELTVRLVDPEEITQLNKTYRKKNKATNVLAFPANIPKEIELDYPLLGDIIICPAVLKEECELSNTPLTAHFAHITIHGVLHLLGYDHINDDDAGIMQAIEIKLLAKLGFADPYRSKVEENEIE